MDFEGLDARIPKSYDDNFGSGNRAEVAKAASLEKIDAMKAVLVAALDQCEKQKKGSNGVRFEGAEYWTGDLGDDEGEQEYSEEKLREKLATLAKNRDIITGDA